MHYFLFVSAYLAQNTPDALLCDTGGTIDDTVTTVCNITCSAGKHPPSTAVAFLQSHWVSPDPVGQHFDLCFTCGGQSACLGCEGIPYVNVNCSAAVTSPSQPSGPVVAWSGTKHFPICDSTTKVIATAQVYR
jgi:hypothetical protein